MDSGDTAGTVIGVLIGVAVLAFFFYIWFQGEQGNRRGPGTSPTAYDIIQSTDGIKRKNAAEMIEVGNPMISTSMITKQQGRNNSNNSSDKIKPASTTPVAKSPLHNQRDRSEFDDDLDNHEGGLENVLLEGIVKHGYLFKKSTGIRKDWLKRCFFITEGKLFYTHNQNDLMNKTQNIQAVQVANLVISTVKPIGPIEFHVISPGQRGSNNGGGVYELQAENEEEAKAWIQIIRNQIQGSLSQALPNGHGAAHPGEENSLFFVPSQSILDDLAVANPYCADCQAESPDWASLNLCVMVCIECSGIHRSLGTHISKIRSLTLDKWTQHNIQLLISIGNERVNTIWEANIPDDDTLPGKPSPHFSRDKREKFIVSKYVDKAYIPDNLKTGGIDATKLAFKSALTGNVMGLLTAHAAGADFNATWKRNGVDTGKTPLHQACDTDNVLCVELLCQLNARLDRRDLDGKTPLDIATSRNASSIADILNHHAPK